MIVSVTCRWYGRYQYPFRGVWRHANQDGPRDKTQLTEGFEEHYRQARLRTPNAVNMTGIFATCVSGLIDIFGWEVLLLAAGVDPDGFGQVTNRYASWIQQYFAALAEADVPVVRGIQTHEFS